jgi:hypothetical protein
MNSGIEVCGMADDIGSFATKARTSGSSECLPLSRDAPVDPAHVQRRLRVVMFGAQRSSSSRQ